MPVSNWKRTTSLGSLILWCRNAITPAFFVLTRMSEWVRDWGSQPYPHPSCLPSLNMKEALEIKSGDLTLGLFVLFGPFPPSSFWSFLYHLFPFVSPFPPPSLYFLSLLLAPWPIDPICRPAPREGKGNYHLLNFSYVPDTVQGVFLTAALWGRYYYYLQFNLRKVKWLAKITQ